MIVPRGFMYGVPGEFYTQLQVCGPEKSGRTDFPELPMGDMDPESGGRFSVHSARVKDGI